MKNFLRGLSVLAVSAVVSLSPGTVGSAFATTSPLTSTVTSFDTAQPTASFVLESSAISSVNAGNLTIRIVRTDDPTVFWAPPGTCSNIPVNNLSACGISSLEFNEGGGFVSSTAKAGVTGGDRIYVPLARNAPAFIRVTFAPGAFTAGPVGTYNAIFSIYPNGGGLVESSVVLVVPGPTSTDAQQAAAKPAGPAIHLDAQLTAGQPLGESRVLAEGQGLKPGSPFSLTLRPGEKTLAEGIVNSGGSFSRLFQIPTGFPPGNNTLTLIAEGLAGESLILVSRFTVDERGIVTSVSAPVASTLAATGVGDSPLLAGTLAGIVALLAGIALVGYRRTHLRG